MCDGRDKNQELLEKLSKQLSELTPTSRSPFDEVLCSDLGNHWAQPSGGPGEENHNTFSGLYTWDPSFLDSSANLNPHHSSHNFPSQDPPPFGSQGLIPPGAYNYQQNINSWNSDLPPFQQDFKAVGDPSVRYSNIPAHSDQRFDTQLGSSNLYQQREPCFQNNSPLVGHGFLNSHSIEPTSLSSVGNNSPTFNSHHQSFNPLNPSSSSHIFGDAIDGFCNRNNSSELVGESAFFDPAPPFDPSTPPPSFSFQRSHSQPTDTTDQRTTDSLPARNEFLDFLRLNTESPINLDFGSNSIGGIENWQTHSTEKDNVSESEDGKQLYAEALNKWNSFDFSGIDSSNDTTENFPSAETQVKELQPESIGQDLSKPSYSDIAKTPVAVPSVPSKSGSNTTTKAGKPYRSLIQRTISASKIWPKGNSHLDIDQPKVSPTSRYGLDNFDDGIQSSGTEGKYGEAVENTPKSKRSGSSASVLDNLSSLEMTGQDITLKDDNTQAHESKIKMKPDQSNKSGEALSKASSACNKSPNIISPGLKSEEKPFFDPKRIFLPKNTNKPRAQSPNVKASLKHGGNEKPSLGETVLNNGKPNASSSSSKLPTAARQHDYINNDLRDTHKLTNKAAAECVNSSHSAHGSTEDLLDKPKESSRPQYGKRSVGSGRVNGSFHREKRKTAEDEPNQEYQEKRNINSYFVSREKIVEWLTVNKEKITRWSKELIYRAFTFLFCALLLVVKLSYNLLCLVYFLAVKAFHMVMAKISGRQQPANENVGWNTRDSVRRRVGLEENIVLPSTGEEAMKRLLACKGKDPYSILGLRQDSTDEDIKKYYKKQAVLVHPDKNQKPGAEEAFKILGHAFDKIGEPGKRKEYDGQALYQSEYELRREFADLLTKLQTKLQEAANMMPCDQCANKHRRVPVDRPAHFARYCEEHKTRHPAREGDVWAETSMLGFYWHYYSVMEGCVYDITEWMKCHEQLYKKMEANEHRVGFKISMVNMKKSKHHQASEANLEDLINRFFPKTPGSPPGHDSEGQPSSGAEPGWGQPFNSPNSTSASTTSAKKTGAGGRRKKKKH